MTGSPWTTDAPYRGVAPPTGGEQVGGPAGVGDGAGRLVQRTAQYQQRVAEQVLRAEGGPGGGGRSGQRHRQGLQLADEDVAVRVVIAVE